MIRIDGNQLGQALGDASPDRNAQSQIGTYHGETIVGSDAASVLVDAAEELCLYVAEQVEHKSPDDREIRTETAVEVLHAEEISAYLDAARTLDDPQKLAALCKRMQSAQESPRRLAREQTRDPAGQYMLLQHALRDGIDSGIPETAQDALREALADLEAEHGAQIRAALNTIGAAAGFSTAREGIAGFQATYRDVALGETTLADTLKLVLERLSGSDSTGFAHGLQSLINALGHDLSSVHPSTEPARLHTLVQDLYQLEVVATVIENCRTLSDTLASRHGIADLPVIDLMKELIDITHEKWVSAGRLEALAIRFGAHDTDSSIALARGIRHMLNDLPPKVFPDADIRQSILSAAQEALDCAIDKEEE